MQHCSKNDQIEFILSTSTGDPRSKCNFTEIWLKNLLRVLSGNNKIKNKRKCFETVNDNGEFKHS